MALKTRASILDIGDILARKSPEFTFQDPPLIAAPNTEITKLNGSDRELPDPSKTLRPMVGIERIHTSSLSRIGEEQGVNGETVFRISASEDRIRFVGDDWEVRTDTQGNHAIAPINWTDPDDYIEVTFYGTGLNLLARSSSLTLEVDVDVDGAPSTSVDLGGKATVLNSREYNTNEVFSVTSGLTLGIHTVRIKGKTGNGDSPRIYGVEILNEDTQIQVPQGEVFADGLKYRHTALEAIDYNSGFDGSPTLNGRGGHVIEYLTPEGTIGKVVQQTEAAQANLGSADHSNESVINRIVPREFGVSRADDFVSLAQDVTSDRAFILNDNTTSLVGEDIRLSGTAGLEDGLFPLSTGDYFIFTFVGTGLDALVSNVSGVDAHEVFIDGVSLGTILPDTGSFKRMQKIVSGLPYGTHTLTVERAAIAGTTFVWDEFIVYGPKEPTIPTDAQKIQNYYLMADFSANSTVGLDTISQGTMRKAVSQREAIYVNGTGGTLDWAVATVSGVDFITGFQTSTNRGSAYVEYTFWGTGFDCRFEGDTNSSASILVQVDGVDMNDTNYPSVTKSAYNGTDVTFNSTTAVLDQLAPSSQPGSGLVISGLPLGLHTVRLTNQSAGDFLKIETFDIITPVHFPNTKTGSLSLGPAIKSKESTEFSGPDLSKAKAWIVFNGTTGQIFEKHNVAALVDESAGSYVIYFEKPFNSDYYAGVVTSNLGEALVAVNGTNKSYASIQSQASGGADTDAGRVSAVFFGSLLDEGEE